VEVDIALDTAPREITVPSDLADALAKEWRATEAAIAEIEAEIPYPLSQVVTGIEKALQRKSFHNRIAEKLANESAWS
jgi:hypothetical protein